MSSFFIDKTDPHIAEILERLRRVNKILQKTETLVQPTLNNERFLTDEELSKILRVSRRTFVIVKTCSDIFYTIGQKKCPMPSAKIRNYSHSHNLVSQ